MDPQYLDFLICPKTHRPLILKEIPLLKENGRIKEGILLEPISENEYPIINFIPRFVSSEGYTSNFGIEWTLHSETQYDEYSGLKLSKERFEKETRWDQKLSDEIILECGSGSGRFTKYALETGAIVVSFDYSNAVEANYHSNGHQKNLLLIQADIFQMPFQKSFFNKAFCFGVLQHTPNPEMAFKTIIEYLKPGGKISSDVYRKYWYSPILPRYLLRHITTRINPKKLYIYVKNYLDLMWPVVIVLRKIPKVGYSIIHVILCISDYSLTIMKYSPDNLVKEFAYLDTFDQLSPKYDYPQKLLTFKKWHEEAGLVDVTVHYGYNGIEGHGTKLK
jgi:SAM-dependent methyltransferase